jgi:hypothetical protein
MSRKISRSRGVRVSGDALAGERVEFPRDLHGPVSFLIVGFSQKSAGQATEWGKAIDGLEPCHGRRLTWFQLPVIAGDPGLVRPLILRSMRNGLSRDLQMHFVPVTDHEADWKAATGYQAVSDRLDPKERYTSAEQARIDTQLSAVG